MFFLLQHVGNGKGWGPTMWGKDTRWREADEAMQISKQQRLSLTCVEVR